MAISKRKKNEIIAQYARHEGDTGSVEVQVAVLTWGNPTILTTTLNNTKRPRYLPWFDEEKLVTVVTCWHTFAVQTLTVTVS